LEERNLEVTELS